MEKNLESRPDSFDIIKISDAINNESLEITQLILNLKDDLTSGIPEKRANGMDILSSVLTMINPDICNEEQFKCLFDYFAARISDKIIVIEKSIPGLYSLCQFKWFNFERASSLFFLFQNELLIQSLKPQVRSLIYQWMAESFDCFKQDFISLGSNFVYGFLKIVDSETAPSCLETVFQMFANISTIPQFESYLEDIFDSMACYFPIMYNKNKKDKNFEIKLRLNQLLNQAMISTPKLSSYVIPLALEKLESQLNESKLCSYELLIMALPNYNIDHIQEFLSELWVSIRIDSLKPCNKNDETREKALTVLKMISKILINSNDSEIILMFTKKIWKDLEISFKCPELGLAYSSAEILSYVFSDNNDLSNFFIQRSFPILLQKFESDPNFENQVACLKSMWKMIEKCSIKIKSEEASKCVSLLLNSGKSKPPQIQKLLILTFREYVRVSELSPEPITNFAINSVQQSGYDTDLINVCLSLIEELSRKHHSIVDELFLDNIIQEIETSDNMDENQTLFHLLILRASCQTISLAKKVSLFLMNRLVFFKNDLQNDIILNYVYNIIGTLKHCFVRFYCDKEFTFYFHETCITRFFKFLIQIYFVEKRHYSFELIEEYVSLLYTYLSLVQKLDNQDITAGIFDRIFLAIKTMNLSSLLEESDSPIMVDRSNHIHVQFILLLAYICLKSSEVLKLRNLEIWDQIKSENFLQIHTPKVTRLLCEVASQIVLKIPNPDSIILATKYLDHALICLEDGKISEKNKILYFEMSIWILRSLFLMKKSEFLVYIDKILDLYKSSGTLRNSFIRLVDVIYEDEVQESHFIQNNSFITNNELSLELHSLILKKYQSNNDVMLLYIYLSHLKYMSKDIKSHEGENLPYIIKGMQLKEYPEINQLCLTLLDRIIENNPERILPQIITIMRLLIEMAKNNPKLISRKKALDTITLMIDSFGEKHLINFKEEFVRSLQPTLSDHKRMVRKSAVITFFKISVLGQPGSNKR